MALRPELAKQIDELVRTHPVVLFMKGTKDAPMCGFSAAVVDALRRCGVHDFVDVDVLQDPELREGIKEYTNWPTLPQLYVGGRFVGGSDIVREMLEAGELQPLLSEALGG